MNLQERFLIFNSKLNNKKGKLCPKLYDQVEQPCGLMLGTAFKKDRISKESWKKHQILIERDYYGKTSSKDIVRKRLRKENIKNRLMEKFCIRYLIDKDTKIININKAILALNLYKHDKLLTRENLIDIYQTQKGFRRFPIQSSYDYYIETGKQPYIIN
mgnify:FL=1